MSSSWRALLWLLLPTSYVGRRPLTSWLSPLVGVSVLLVILFIPLVILGQTYREIQSIDEASSSHLFAFSHGDLIKLKELASQQALKKMSIDEDPPPTTPVLFLGAPPKLTEAASLALVSRGGEVATPDCQKCVVLTWQPGRGWSAHLRGPQEPENLSVMTSALAIRKGLLEKSPPPNITLAPEDFIPATKSLLSSSITVFSCAFVMLVGWLSILSMSVHGYRWDLWRNAGFLEPWVLAHHPPRILFMSQLLRHILLVCGVYGALLVVGWWLSVPLPWRFAWVLFALLPSLSLFVGLWGFLATVMFHHRRGRMFARLALSPALLIMGWGVRLGLVWMTLRTQQPFMVWETLSELDQSFALALAMLPVLWLGCGVLWVMIDLRIGRRREGLRQAK